MLNEIKNKGRMNTMSPTVGCSKKILQILHTQLKMIVHRRLLITLFPRFGKYMQMHACYPLP